jgi:hypothetical protein
LKVPNAHLAVVEREKITEYLLNEAHRYGASKARFFTSFGFRRNAWEVLAQALLEHGQRHEVDGELETPGGGRPRARTVWQLDQGQVAPRLITAYPLEVTND